MAPSKGGHADHGYLKMRHLSWILFGILMHLESLSVKLNPCVNKQGLPGWVHVDKFLCQEATSLGILKSMDKKKIMNFFEVGDPPNYINN